MGNRTYSYDDAIAIAKEWGLEEEVRYEMECNGCTPAEALYEWDLLEIDDLIFN